MSSVPPSHRPRRGKMLVLFLLVAVGILIAPPGVAAHNSLDGSTPADGAVLPSPPTQIVWDFTNTVPLDTLTVTLIDATGARTELSGSHHGSDSSEVVTPLPALAGTVTLRWRLVGPDGHPVTDRVSFTIGAPPPAITATTTAAALPPDLPGATGATDGTGAVPAGGAAPAAGDQAVPASSPAPDATSPAPAVDVSDDDLWSTPGALRWLLRAASYLAMMVAAGVALTDHLIVQDRRARRFATWLRVAFATIAITAVLQLLVIASDVVGRPWPRALDGLDAAVDTHAGMAFVIRLVLALVAWLLVVESPPRTSQVRSGVLVLLALGLLGTWSFAGHSRSLRWPAVGIPLDVLHHGAAAAWLGGLVIIGLVLLPKLPAERAPRTAERFSNVATAAVITIVATGALQAVRLVGDPTDVVATTHGRLLLLKIAALAGMLALGDANRRRVHAGLRSAGAAGHLDVAALRRVMLIEFAVGIAVIGITAALVVSTPVVAG